MRGLLAAAFALLMGACGGVDASPPDIVLISLDTVRADDAAEQMPNLARFASAGLQLGQAYSASPFTLSSHVTMLFGRGVETHRVLSDTDRIPDSLVGLAEHLRAHGYRTTGLFTNEWIGAKFGFDRGFDEYLQIPHASRYADRVVAAALERLTDDSEGPRFLFVHFMDAHSDFPGQGTGPLPYWAPDEALVDLEPFDRERTFCRDEQCATLWLQWHNQAAVPPAPESLALVHELYRRGLRTLDTDLEPLFAVLEARARDTVVVVTSDHGEEFWEHGQFLHAQVYEESLRVPLVIRADGRLGRSGAADELAGVVDIARTIAGLAGLPAPSAWEGRDLNQPPSGPVAVLARHKFAERWSLRSPRWTWIAGASEGAELYDRRADRAEARESKSSYPDAAKALDRRLAERIAGAGVVARSATDGSSALDAEERARLRALGYLD